MNELNIGEASSLFNWLAVLLALAAVLVTWSIGYTQNRATKAANRAYLDPTFGRMNVFELGKQIQAQVTFKNVGLTPAFDARIRARVYLLPTEQKWDEVALHSKAELPPAFVAAGDKYVALDGEAPTAGQREWEAIHAGLLHIYVQAIATYTDVFGDTHTTRVWANYQLKSDFNNKPAMAIERMSLD